MSKKRRLVADELYGGRDEDNLFWVMKEIKTLQEDVDALKRSVGNLNKLVNNLSADWPGVFK